MKIGIDARFLTHPQRGGFKTYTESLISALAHLDSENEYILYVDRQPGIHDEIPMRENFRTKVVPGIAPLLGVPWREQVALTRQAWRDQIDLFHSPCLTAPLKLFCPLVITVHDMIWASPEYFTGRNSISVKRRLIDWYNYVVPKFAIQKAASILTVSHASKKKIVDILGIEPERVFVTHEAAGPEFHRIEDRSSLAAVRRRYNLPSSFILALGAADPRKNIESFIHAYALLPEEVRRNFPLVIVWSHSFLAHEVLKLVETLDLVREVTFLQQVPNKDLVLIYNLATLFVFPSRHEGFGLPILEAMACGVPVAAADNSSIPEIAGDAAIFFDAEDIRAMARAVMQILNDGQLRSGLIQRGYARSSAFSWLTCACETVNTYRRAASFLGGG